MLTSHQSKLENETTSYIYFEKRNKKIKNEIIYVLILRTEIKKNKNKINFFCLKKGFLFFINYFP